MFDLLVFVSRYCLILDRFYVMFQDYYLEIFIVIVYKGLDSQTNLFQHCYSLDLEKANIDRMSQSSRL